MRHLVEKFNLMEEMFGNKAAGQVEANKQVSHLLNGVQPSSSHSCSLLPHIT